MTTVKITKRDNLTALSTLIAAARDAGFADYNFDALDDYVANEVALLDKKAEAAKARAAKNKAEGDALRDEVYNSLSRENFTTIPEIVNTINREDVTAQKITARLTQLVKLNKVEKSEIAIETEDGKTRKVKGYRIIGE